MPERLRCTPEKIRYAPERLRRRQDCHRKWSQLRKRETGLFVSPYFSSSYLGDTISGLHLGLHPRHPGAHPKKSDMHLRDSGTGKIATGSGPSQEHRKQVCLCSV